VRVIRLRSGFGPVSPLLTQQLGRPILNGARIRRLLHDGRFDVTMFHNASLVGGPGVFRHGVGVVLYEAHEHWLVCPTHVLWRHNREACTGRQCVRCILRHHRPPQIWRFTGYLERELGHVDAFIAKSEFSRQKHREFGFPREMEVIPYFLPEVRDHQGSGWGTQEGTGDGEGREWRQPQLNGGRPYFLFVGRLEKIKGLDEVIPAVGRIAAEADLLIAGEGEYGATLRRIAVGSPNVRFLGRIPPERLRSLYRHAVALVVPSVCFETFGIILIEAFQQGTPVIARRIGPFPEIIDACGGGLLFGGMDEMLASMRALLGSPELRERLARAGQRGFRERWSEDAVVPEYLELVRRTAERKGETRIVQKLVAGGVA
jgi:glycosyltransferase involved in cell wall biosynthesis